MPTLLKMKYVPRIFRSNTAAKFDKDGPIPPFRAPEIAHLNHEQQEKYDSRSRFFLETEKAWAKAEKQMAFSKKRKQFTEVEENEIDTQAATSVDQFATFDAETRKSVDAIKRHHAAFEAVSVASARLEQEEREAAADLNKDPNALNKLADIAELQRPATPVGRKLAGRTPRSTRTMPSKRSSTENVFAPVDESPAVPPSTLRRSRRTSLSRTRENSPEKQATPQNSIFERSQTPKSSTSKIQDLLNQEPPSQLPPISETAADEPRATMDAVTKSEMGTTDVVHPLHYHQVYVDDLPSIPGLALREDQERQEYRNLDRVPLEVARSWIESVPKIEPSRTPAGRKAGAGSFWSRLGKLPSSREQSVDKDHRPCEGSTSNSLASDRRASDNTPSTARSPRISTPIHIPDSTSGVRHIPGSHSAVETGNADASQNTSPTTNHNRGASLGHRSRQSWESGEAARRASIAVPHQFSSQDRRNQRPSLDPSLLTPIHTQPAPVPGSSRPPPERPYEASTRSDRDRRYSGTGGPPTPSQANYQTYPSPYGQPVPPHYQPNYYGHPPPGYWPAPPPHMLPYGPPPTGAPHTAQAYDQGYYHHPPYSGAPPFPPPPGAYHYPPPHSLPPPHFPPYVGQPIHPASSPTAVGPLPAFPPPGQSPFSEQQGPAPGPNQTEYRRNSSEHARPKSNPPKHGERMGRAAAFRHYDYAKQTRR